MSGHYTNLTRRFRSDERGSVAVMFGLLAIPMVLFVGLAVDYSRAVSADRNLRQAVDAAAIAAAVYKMEKLSKHSDTNESEGKSVKRVAIDYVRGNVTARYMKNIISDARENGDDNTLTVTAKAEVPATFAGVVIDKFNIAVSATARMSGKPAPLCVLGLNQAAPETVKAWGTADLIAPECAVVSNSTADDGLATGGSATMTGAAFCSAGGVSGTAFTPQAREKCVQHPDPYADEYTLQALQTAGLDVPGTCDHSDSAGVKQDTTFSAGGSVFNFCKGLSIKTGATATLGPGVYVIFGDLSIGSQATLKATGGTTLILADDRWDPNQKGDGRIYVSSGGNLLLTAPTSGPTKSMAVIQPTVSSYAGGATAANEHTIIGGGSIEIVGNWYTPQSKTRITGNGNINANSAYFSMISDIVELEGNGVLRIKAGGDPSSIGMTPVPGQSWAGGHISLVE